MTDSTVPFSLLDAARVVARGGSLEAKLASLAEQAHAATGAVSVVMLLHDPDAAVLISIDGENAIETASASTDLTQAIADREPIATSGIPTDLEGMLPGATNATISPLVVADGEDTFVEGLLVIGHRGEAKLPTTASEALTAISDLAAVAIRQARLHNTAWENSDHADRLLHTDRLTGLANRVTFERMLELEIARATRQGTPLAIVVLDVDGLTTISKAKGAKVADDVLRHVASAIADRVRLLDTVARFGDDEFVVIAPGDAGGIVALRLRDAIRELPPVGDVDVSVSAAVVHHPTDGATGIELVAASESALEAAKSAGPGSIYGVQASA